MREAPDAYADYPISDEEFGSRLEALRAAMAEEGLEAVITYGAHRDYQPADLRYFARWYCVEEETAALLVPREGPTVLFTDASWDVGRAEVEGYADAVKHAPDLGDALVKALEDAVGRQSRIGIAGYRFFPAPAYLAMTAALPNCVFADASELTGKLRMVKSAAELDLMREASRISDEGMRAGLEVIADGATEQEVAAAAEAAIRAAGAEPSFVTEMGAGPRTAYGTFLPGRRRLAQGEIAVLDCGARYYGYHGDMCRTVVVGDPSPAQERMLKAVETSVNESIAAVRPGVTVGAIRDVAAAAIADAGFGDNWWDAFMPHGNGTGQHEMPNAKEHPDLELQGGMVLCIEPGITVADEGAVIIEQMIAVTEHGAEVLNKLRTNMWDR
jgi:Xaa-Pro aminopeptidase